MLCVAVSVCGGWNYEERNHRGGNEVPGLQTEVSGNQKPSTLLGKSCLGGVDVKATLEDIIFASSFFNWFHQLALILASDLLPG